MKNGPKRLWGTHPINTTYIGTFCSPKPILPSVVQVSPTESKQKKHLALLWTLDHAVFPNKSHQIPPNLTLKNIFLQETRCTENETRLSLSSIAFIARA